MISAAFRNNGFTLPAAIFKQMSWMIYMKMHDEKQLQTETAANMMGIPVLQQSYECRQQCKDDE